MVAENYNVQFASGLIYEGGSRVVSMTLLCGVSGTSVIPVQVNAAGRLITTSGA